MPKTTQTNFQEEYHRKSERRFWLFSTVLSIITTFAAIAAAIAAVKALNDTRNQVEATQSQLDAIRTEQRAWISIEPKTTSITSQIYPDEVNFDFDVDISNSGHLPASDIILHREFDVIPPSVTNLDPSNLVKVCESKENIETRDRPFALFPGHVTKSNINYSLHANKILSGRTEGQKINDYLRIVLNVCVSYRVAGQRNIIGLTALSFNVSYRNYFVQKNGNLTFGFMPINREFTGFDLSITGNPDAGNILQ